MFKDTEMATSDQRRVCVTCGTQFHAVLDDCEFACRMCIEPRQFFLSPTGQAWTSLAKMQGVYHNEIKQDEVNPRIWSIFTQPQFAIGQRAMLIETDHGNILWDCVAHIDQQTIDFIMSKGGLEAIAISHPHFYTTHLTWAEEFGCPVYLADTEQEWLNRNDLKEQRTFASSDIQEILTCMNMIRLRGHFPGSSVLRWDKIIFTGDTIGISFSGLNLSNHTREHQVFFFHYAQPNFIPLGPTGMHYMWKGLRKWDFHTLHSLFYGTYVRHPDVKRLVLESMQLQARYEEHEDHAIMAERCDSVAAVEA